MRSIATQDRLTADVEGDIEEVEGVLRITRIRMHYRLQAETPDPAAIQRALETYADKCPAYQSVKGCIDCSWDLEVVAL